MGVASHIAPHDTRQANLKSVPSMLFDLAYDRIWRGMGIKFWEWLFWIPLAIVLGFRFYGFSIFYIDSAIYILSWLFIQVIPLFVIPSWVNMAHASTGLMDNSLRSVPVTPSGIIWPRVKSVLISAIQIFAPAALAVLVLGDSINPTVSYGFGLLLLGGVQMVGWILFLTMWGFAAASIVSRRGGNFFIWFYTPGVVLVLIVIPLLIGGFIEIDYMGIVPEEGVFGSYFGAIYILGLLASPLAWAFACRKWGERSG